MEKENGIFRDFSPIHRALLFYLICIWIRLYIAFFIYKNYKKKFVIYLVLFFSLIAIYLNFSKLNGKVWWNRYIHGFNALILFIYSILIINNFIKDGKILGKIMFFDVLFGILYSLYKKPFSI